MEDQPAPSEDVPIEDQGAQGGDEDVADPTEDIDADPRQGCEGVRPLSSERTESDVDEADISSRPRVRKVLRLR